MSDPYEVLETDVMIKMWQRDIDLLSPWAFPPVHLADDGKPLCQTGGFFLPSWVQMTVEVLRVNICKRCLLRKEASDRKQAQDDTSTGETA